MAITPEGAKTRVLESAAAGQDAAQGVDLGDQRQILGAGTAALRMSLRWASEAWVTAICGLCRVRIFRPPGRLVHMQLGIALTPIVWLVVIAAVVLGGVAVRSAGARGWWVIAGIAALLVATNPSADDHDDALRSEVRSILRHEVDRELDGAGRFAAAAFEHLGGDKAVSMLLDVGYQNFVLFSRATVDGKVVAVGVLGNVFVELSVPPSSSRKRRR